MATREQTFSPPDSHERALTLALTRAYALNWEVVAYVAIFALAMVTRFIDLGARVMSHDESLHTYYSWRLYEFGEFNHTPLMHGPLLFHMTALSYFLFGDSDFTSRIYPAFLGVLVVMFPWLLRRWLGRTGALIASVMLLISPELLYYSRYIRHDIPTMFFALVLIYAVLQYLDGEVPRRAVWLWVISGSLLGMLASKEVAFIYIAIFGTFMLLFWLFRMVQDVGIERRRADDPDWQPPALQQIAGHVLLFGFVDIVAFMVSVLLRFLLRPAMWIPSVVWIDVPLFIVLYLPLALSGVLRNALPSGDVHRARRSGAAQAIMQGLSNGRSAFLMIMTGLIIGTLIALLIVCVVDVIKIDQVWTQTTVRSQYDQMYGSNLTKEYATATGFDSAMFVRLVTWIGLPVLVILFVLFLTAVIRFPGHIPLPWREMLLILLIAFVTTSVLVMFERRSYVTEAKQAPFAADPNASSISGGDGYDNTPIISAWVFGALVTLVVVVTRVMTNWWDFLNRQPVFDLLVLLGALILPWLAAFPLYWAGYNLETYDPNTIAGRDTLKAALPAVIPFLMVSISVGMAWNWRRFLPAALLFLGLFAFFFTTVFSNQYGLVTGMIGSLGYWLEQQGVRRGSQPQYYYVLTQLPVYEFLPMIGAMCAGVAGLSNLWRWRRDRTLAARHAKRTLALDDDAWDVVEVESDDFDASPYEPDRTLASELNRTAPSLPLPGFAPDESGEMVDTYDDDTTPRGPWARLFRPFDPDEERAHRAADPEWIGAFPFLALIGWWCVAILLGLTVAGEKMPWLTTHLTLPLILVSGWWLGRVASSVSWDRLREGGWLVLLVALPLAFMAFAQAVLGLWGENPPFRGRDVESLTASGNWLAAFLILLGALYLVGRFGRRLGWGQIGRMAVLSGALILAILTARVAFLASYINYDYATEFLVYAHAGPAIKTVLEEVDHIAAITNEGTNMRIAFDDESSWPYTWYFRNYPNYGFMRGEAGSVDPSTLEGARVVVVGNKKAGDVRRILGDRYYEFSYIRLWWPMQEYFGLNYDRVVKIFSTEEGNVAARYYREGLWDIWWNRDYSTYGQAMCIEAKQFRCEDEASRGATDQERDQLRASCERAVVAECASDDRFSVNKWPVSDRMYVFVDKQIAAQVWDAGIGSSTVNIREPEYPEDHVFQEIPAQAIIGSQVGMMGPRGVAVSDDGLVYIADMDRNRVVVLSQAGELVREIGVPGTVEGDIGLKQPWGLDLGPDGYLYIADTWNNRVAVYTTSGEFVRAWGHEGVPSSDSSPDAMWGPRELKIGPDGNVYVADTGGKRIRVYTPEGGWVRDIGSAGSSLGQLDEPVGLAFNPVSGNLYVAEAWNKRIQVFDTSGVPLRTFDVNMWFRNRQSFNRPYLAVSPDGTLIYVTDMDDRHRIVAYNLDGQPVLAFNQPDDLETGVLGLRSPAGLAFDAQGRLYVVDAELGEVYVFPPSEITGGILPQGAGALIEPGGAVDSGAVESGAESGESQPLGAVDQPDLPLEVSNAGWQPIEQVISGLPVVYVPAGCFQPGVARAEGPAQPEVCLTAFWMSETEVTNTQYAACVDAGACVPPQDRTYFDAPDFASAPVVFVTWQQAADYAAWVGGSLPTEAQWEYAARGPAGWSYPWGEAEPICGLANTNACGGLLPVGGGQRIAGAAWVGAVDLAGSVWEWTADWFAEAPFSGLAVGALDPTGPASGTERVVRGGAWNEPAVYAHSARRESRLPAAALDAVGIRVVIPVGAVDPVGGDGAAPPAG